VNAVRRLSWRKLQTTNLYLDERIYERAEMIGPERQKIVTEWPSILVFADDDPLANFSHACRYLLHDPQTGDLQKEIPAQFPPFVNGWPKTLKPFHEPIQLSKDPIVWPIPPKLRCPITLPYGERYAIMFSGMSNKRHLNDMEFLYRTLIDRYYFNKNNIYALNYDGTLNTQDGVQVNWPGNNTPYRIKITGQGTRSAFEAAINDLKGKITQKDMLLIHTNNHGGYGGAPGTADLCTYPSWHGYLANDFALKVGELPKFSKLIVMMEQCHAGGFNGPIISQSKADATSVASAATEPNNSYVTADGNWDPFARDWISAQAGHGALGGALAFNPDTDHDGRIEAREAYNYADVIQDPRDSPNYSENTGAGGDIALGQEYVTWWWWCAVLTQYLERHFIRLPPEEYYPKLHKAQLELSKLNNDLDKRSDELRGEYTKKIQVIINDVFGKAET
jgi:hypothetical protein